ncbi:MAG: TetR/AcrR family transcriptional regulator [Deltaproteobacteria bacterium]|nr:MAG: TetR/AcrR family transcriptional regulator [Deltaproteobacteria bacterium]
MKEKGIRTRERVLAGATEIFHRQGFSGTTIHDLIRETGVKKGNLYHYFSSKEEMGIEVLFRARDDFFAFLEKSLQGDTPSARLTNHFDSIARYHEDRKLVGGCIFGNTALEMSDRNEAYRAVIRDVFDEWRRRIRDVLESAVRSGETRKDLDPDSMARHVVATVQGGILVARASRNPAELKECLAVLAGILGIGAKTAARRKIRQA